MELEGLSDFLIWRYDASGKLLTDPENGGLQTNCGIPGVFKVDLQSSKGATQANITGLAPSAQKVYGSDAVAEISVGTANPQVALAANDIPHTVYDSFAGLVKDKFGGYAKKDNFAVNGGCIIHSRNPNKNIDLYMAFPNGTFTPGELNLQTNNENPSKVHDALTLQAQARGTDMLLYEKFYSDEKDFDYTSMIGYITGAQVEDPTHKQADPTPQGK
ncbi:phage tail protein [Lactobacillus sp. LL6]|uniref:phage tail protein n=1 Tax=Lactobacillus sp. LL6 TaxID=2596827 RepID=UPI001185D518|nr:phage tail protein [Lactobacillus sp. LL6]TSO25291.1 phage tail protein [Lactobacillus sp. LL6]